MKAEAIENRGGVGPSGYQPVVAPQCEADVVKHGQPSYRKDIPPRCLRKSQYKLGGKHLCAYHAGIAALDYLVRNGTVGEEMT